MTIIIGMILILGAISLLGLSCMLFIEPIIEFELWAWNKPTSFFLILAFIVSAAFAIFLLFTAITAIL
jgi:hypothetical protein